MTVLMVAVIFTTAEVNAQTKPFQGIIYEQGTPLRVGEALIQNLNTNARAKTNYMGEFTIPASDGDTLLITKPEYADYKLPVKPKKVTIIQLIRIRKLAEVVITAPSKKEELDEVVREYRKKGSFYQGKPPLLAYVFKPLTALYELIGKTPGQARRFSRYYENELEQSEIDRRFNRSLVKAVTNLEDIDLKNFMITYRPEYTKLAKWNDYDLRNYITASLKAFNANGRPQAETLPDLRKIQVMPQEN